MSQILIIQMYNFLTRGQWCMMGYCVGCCLSQWMFIHVHQSLVLLRVYGNQQNKVALAPNVWGCYLMCEWSLGLTGFSIIRCLCWMMWSVIISWFWYQREPRNIKQKSLPSVIRNVFHHLLRIKYLYFGTRLLTCVLDALTHTT